METKAYGTRRNWREAFLATIPGYHPGPFMRSARALMASAAVTTALAGRRDIPCIKNDDRLQLSMVGLDMEETAALLKAVNLEVEESKKNLETLANEISALSDIVAPALRQQVIELRESRMTVTREVRETLAQLRDIRSFFLEANYEREMERMERLIGVCKEIQALKATGVFDVICEAALRLAVQEKPQA